MRSLFFTSSPPCSHRFLPSPANETIPFFTGFSGPHREPEHQPQTRLGLRRETPRVLPALASQHAQPRLGSTAANGKTAPGADEARETESDPTLSQPPATPAPAQSESRPRVRPCCPKPESLPTVISRRRSCPRGLTPARHNKF